MITFLDEAGKEYGALSEVKLTNAVNGERSLTGDIYTNPNVLNKIDKGWRLRFGDEYFVVTYAKPIDNGRKTQVSFDAVHQFFWDFQKNPVYSQLSDGSHTFQAYLDFIFDGSGYSYTIDSELKVKAFEKQSFGMKNRLTLFNDIIKSAGVEFAVNGKIVRILARVGTDLSTIVRKNFNMSDFKIEKNIGNFITYQKGFGAWKDSEDHSKGRLEVEYESPLAKVYGRLSTDPVVDERYTQKDSLLAVLKENVDNSCTISVGLSMEDLTRAGYSYTKPIAGDYIMAINEQIGFREKIRIVSFTSSYDVRGQLIEHTVTCNDLGTVQKQTATYSKLSDAVAANAESSKNAVVLAQQAMVSADGKNRVYFGTTYPADVPKGTLTKGDQLYLTVGDQVKMYYWNGAEWLPVPIVNDVERFKADIAQQFSDVDQQITEQQQAHDRAVAEILSQAESAQSLAAQAKTIGDQAKADAVSLASQLSTAKIDLQNSIAEAKARAATVANNLATAKSDLQNQVTAINAKAVKAQTDVTQAKSDLQTQTAQLNAQAAKQVELSKLTTDTKKLADGTLTSLNELSKTVDKNTGNITSVANRTKTVEDSLAGVKTNYTQLNQTVNVQTGQIDSINRKTADLQSGIDGVTERFENLRVGQKNLILNSDKLPFKQTGANTTIIAEEDCFVLTSTGYTANSWGGVSWDLSINRIKAGEEFSVLFPIYLDSSVANDAGAFLMIKNHSLNIATFAQAITGQTDKWFDIAMTFKATRDLDLGTKPFYLYFTKNGKLRFKKPILVGGNVIPSDWSLAEEDFSNQIAEYKRTAEQNYSGLQSTVQSLDGKITQNKTQADQTAESIKSRLTSLETYKDGENSRKNAYFEAAKTETAKQIIAERSVVAQNYTAKSTYIEDYNGITRRLTATETVANNATTKIATYQETNDRRVAALETAKISTDGTLTQLSNKVEQNAQQTRETISAVKAKIPTEYGGNMILDSGKGWTNKHHVTFSLALPIVEGQTYTVTARWWRSDNGTLNVGLRENDSSNFSQWVNLHYDSSIDLWTATFTAQINISAGQLFHFFTVENDGVGNADFAVLTKGAIPITSWSAVSSEIATEISNVKLDITKNADGFERRITETKALIPTENSGNLLLDSGTGWTNVHSKTYVLAENLVNGKTYTITSHFWNTSGSTGHTFSIGDGVWRRLNYDSTVDSWVCTFTVRANVAKGTSVELATDPSTGLGSSSFVTLVKGSTPLSVWQPAFSELATVTAFNLVKDTVDAHKRIIGDGSSISSAIQSAKKFEQQIASGGEIYQAIATAKGLVTTVSGPNGLTSQVSQLAGSYAIKNLTNAGTVLNQLNLNKDGSVRIDGKLVQITGKTYVENGVIKDAMISNLNAGKITAGTLDASKINVINLNASNIVSGTMTANRIKGGMLTSMNGNTTFDLNNGNLIFNNNYGYIRRSVNNKVFEISSKLYEATSLSSEHLQVDLMVRKNDYSRKAGISFLIFDTYNGKESSSTEIATDSLTIYGSNSTGNMLTITNDNTFLGNVTVASWSEKNIMNFNGGIRSNDIVIGSKMKPLSKIIKELCDKAGLIWI